MTTHENFTGDELTDGFDPEQSQPKLDRAAWMAAAKERHQGLIRYWAERGRWDMVAELQK